MHRLIVIVGFMGCGKTTVARALGKRLGCEVIDLDSFIAERQGRSPAAIIQKDGEPIFRDIETRALKDVLKGGNARIIALGGGTWTIEANRELMTKHNCLSIWLNVPFETCWQRIIASRNAIRPLAPDYATARELHGQRLPAYAGADIHVTPDSNSVESIVDEIFTHF